MEALQELHGDGRRRVVIEGVAPEIDGGRFPIKRATGEPVEVEADIFADGHGELSAVVLFRRVRGEDGEAQDGGLLVDAAPAAGPDDDGESDAGSWREVPMEPLGNDRWRASFRVDGVGRWRYTIEAWADRWKSWRHDFGKRVEAGQDVAIDLLAGAALVEAAGERAGEAGRERDARVLAGLAETLGDPEQGEARLALALDPELSALVERYPDRRLATRHPRELDVVVDPERAVFSAWYEMFPRSAAPEPGRHGTFADVEARLPYIEEMGFDVLYLPPIHPIGAAYRKGRNNAPAAEPGDVGSPWAIGAGGAGGGGHKAILPELGSAADFRHLVAAARERGIEIALDIAFQASPDHPYVEEHPEWFAKRPDGTIQYAENPPKKYQDIYPFDFESTDWRALWEELESVFLHWIGEGVRVFRVDNPHTKPFAFWEWLIGRVKRRHPEVVFLSEAFTRPKVMYRLAKLGFTQSYTYFAWRTGKEELTEYLTELTRTEVAEYFRPNLWPNTPDILTAQLQHGGPPVFAVRLLLAATLGASYGIYGPAFELAEGRAVKPGSEEYLDSEKYQLRHWQLDHPDSLAGLVGRINRIRRDNPALRSNRGLAFHGIDNGELLVYSKRDESGESVILVAVNLDPHHTHAGWTALDLEALGVEPDHQFQVHDLLTGERYLWQGPHNYVELGPHRPPAHVFRVRRRTPDEHDFEYFV